MSDDPEKNPRKYMYVEGGYCIFEEPNLTCGYRTLKGLADSKDLSISNLLLLYNVIGNQLDDGTMVYNLHCYNSGSPILKKDAPPRVYKNDIDKYRVRGHRIPQFVGTEPLHWGFIDLGGIG